MKKFLPLTLLLLVVDLCVAQQKKIATKNISTYFTAEKKYLVLPVKNGAAKRNIELWVDGVNTRFFDIELAEQQADWYAYLQIDQWKGKPIELRVDTVATDSKVFSPILQSDADTNYGPLYQEKYRGQIHFSQKRGWANDPNGMVYYNGEYHFFFQHNPYGVEWGNMSWGHAVSKDLIHWKELDVAFHPDQFGPVFSGGAVVDSQNTSGLGQDGKPAMVLFHTGAKGWGQYLSWTLDGKKFQTLDHAVVPRINKDNRDPKVIWYAPTKKWVMILYVEREKEQHSMQFLTSPDLKNWTMTSIVNGGIGDDRYLFECPEFYELPVQGSQERKWVLTGANTQYAIGTFDGTTFKPEEERLNEQVGRDFYAPQTFSDEPGGRRIEIGWWRTYTGKAGMNFNLAQSIPLEHRLVKTPEGVRLTRMPVKELENLRVKTYKIGNTTLKPGSNPFKNIEIELAELRLEIIPGKSGQVILNLRGVPVAYDVNKQEISVDGVKAKAPLQNGKLNLIVYVDRIGVEIFINDGMAYMPINVLVPTENGTISISSEGGVAKIANTVVYELKSIWE